MEKQKESDSILCIFDENSTEEWFYVNNEWCCFKTKEHNETIGNNPLIWSEIVIERKYDKQFSKDCCVREMSFDNLIIVDYMEFHGTYKNINADIIKKYTDKYLQLKKEKKEKENIDYSLENYHELLKKEIETQKGCLKSCFKGCYVVLLAFLFL